MRPGVGAAKGLPIGIAVGLGIGLLAALKPPLALLAIVGIGATLLALQRPAWLVVGMFVGILFDRLGVTGANLADFPITASKLTVLGSLGLWTVHTISQRATPFRFHPVLVGLLAMAGAAALSAAHTGTLGNGRFVIFGMVMMAVLVGLVFAILAEAELGPTYRICALAIALAMTASLAGGGGAGEAARATGTFGDPNEWAAMLLLLVPFLLGGLVEDSHPLARPLRLALLLLLPLALLKSGSRAALVVGALVIPGCLWLFGRRRAGEVGIALLLGLLAAPFAGDLGTALVRFQKMIGNLEGTAVQADESLDERTELFHQAVDLFRDHWLVGAGPGNFGRASGFISLNGRFRPAHNTFLEIASEQGIIGLGATALLLVLVALALRAALRAAPDPTHLARVAGCTIGLVGVGLMAGTLGLLTFSMAYLVLGFTLAVAHQALCHRGLDG